MSPFPSWLSAYLLAKAQPPSVPWYHPQLSHYYGIVASRTLDIPSYTVTDCPCELPDKRFLLGSPTILGNNKSVTRLLRRNLLCILGQQVSTQLLPQPDPQCPPNHLLRLGLNRRQMGQSDDKTKRRLGPHHWASPFLGPLPSGKILLRLEASRLQP